MKTIYSASIHDPVKIILTDKVLNRIKKIQSYLKKIKKKLSEREHISCDISDGIINEWKLRDRPDFLYIIIRLMFRQL